MTRRRDAADVIRDQVQRRYGLDVDTLGADDASVAQALAKAERDREQAEQERRAGCDGTARLCSYSPRLTGKTRTVSRTQTKRTSAPRR